MGFIRSMRFVTFLLSKQRTIDYFNQLRSLATTLCVRRQLTEEKCAQDSQLTIHKLPADVDKHDLLDNFNKSLQSEMKKFNEKFDSEYLDSLSSPLPISFNLAAYANKSHTLKKLIDLGVQLYEVERSKEACELILRLDFERDIKKYLIFLNDIGIDPKNLGYFITKYPMIFDEEMENLETRVKYLQVKKFKRSAIINILTQHPAFLSKSIYEIDSKLGFLQNQYNLNAVQIRKITEKWPFIVDITQQWHKVCLFMFKEEMGFNEKEMHNILVTLPSLFAERRHQAVERFDLIHNEYGVSHELISRFPQVLQCNIRIMKERHLYLEKLKRVQYDPTKPCYIPLFSLTELISDTEFAEKLEFQDTVHWYWQYFKTPMVLKDSLYIIKKDEYWLYTLKPVPRIIGKATKIDTDFRAYLGASLIKSPVNATAIWTEFTFKNNKLQHTVIFAKGKVCWKYILDNRAFIEFRNCSDYFTPLNTSFDAYPLQTGCLVNIEAYLKEKLADKTSPKYRGLDVDSYVLPPLQPYLPTDKNKEEEPGGPQKNNISYYRYLTIFYTSRMTAIGCYTQLPLLNGFKKMRNCFEFEKKDTKVTNDVAYMKAMELFKTFVISSSSALGEVVASHQLEEQLYVFNETHYCTFPINKLMTDGTIIPCKAEINERFFGCTPEQTKVISQEDRIFYSALIAVIVGFIVACGAYFYSKGFEAGLRGPQFDDEYGFK